MHHTLLTLRNENSENQPHSNFELENKYENLKLADGKSEDILERKSKENSPKLNRKEKRKTNLKGGSTVKDLNLLSNSDAEKSCSHNNAKEDGSKEHSFTKPKSPKKSQNIFSFFPKKRTTKGENLTDYNEEIKSNSQKETFRANTNPSSNPEKKFIVGEDQQPSASSSETTPKVTTKPKSTKQVPVVEEDGKTNYYPKCDPRVWVRTCTHPVVDPIEGVKFGGIPKWLKGTLVRNGPGRVQVGEETYKHIFDGSALLHRFYFKNGNVTYKNKFLESSSYLKDTKAQRIVANSFGTVGQPDPCRTTFKNLSSKFSFEDQLMDNAQISVYPYGDGLYALTETPFAFRVDPTTLDTKEKINMMNYLAIFTHTSHPHIGKNGNVYNIGQGVGLTGPVYHVCEFPNGDFLHCPFEKARIIGSIKARWALHPCYMHSFAITQNFFVIIEQPMVLSLGKILKGLFASKPMIEALQWWDKGNKFHVMNRITGETYPIKYETDTFFFLHTINAYEENEHIVLDIAAYKDAQMLNCMYLEALKNAAYNPSYAEMFRGRPKRWVLPLKPKRGVEVKENLITLPNTECYAHWINRNTVYLEPELLADIGCEVPRINDKYVGEKYQYFYAICSDVDYINPGTLIKVDVINKTRLEWAQDNAYPSEPIFIQSPNSDKEDDGVIVSTILRCKGLDNQICLVVLDAATFQEKGRVEFECEGPVPKCLHGWFVPEGKLEGKKVCKTEDASQTEDEKSSTRL